MSAAPGYEFHHIHVFCSDLETTAHWFIEGVGATLVGRGESRGVPSVTLSLGGAPVLLRPAREGEALAEAGARRFGTDHFGLKVADIDATVTELRSHGVQIEVEPWDFSPSMRIAFIKGPDEVRIELVQSLP